MEAARQRGGDEDETRRDERQASERPLSRCQLDAQYSLPGGGHGTCGRKACGVGCGRPAGSGLTGPRPAAAKIGVARFAHADRLAVFFFSEEEEGGKGVV